MFEEIFESEFDSVFDLIENIDYLLDLFNGDQSVNVIADYYLVTDLLCEYIKNNDETYIGGINISDEYETCMITFDQDGGIWVDGVNPNIIILEDDVTFIHSNVNSKFIVNNPNAFFIEFNYKEECDGDCDNCALNDDYKTELSHDNNGYINGFTRSKTKNNSYYSESFYSSNPNLVLEQLKKFKF